MSFLDKTDTIATFSVKILNEYLLQKCMYNLIIA